MFYGAAAPGDEFYEDGTPTTVLQCHFDAFVSVERNRRIRHVWLPEIISNVIVMRFGNTAVVGCQSNGVRFMGTVWCS